METSLLPHASLHRCHFWIFNVSVAAFVSSWLDVSLRRLLNRPSSPPLSSGINVTATVFTSTPEPVGYGYTQYATSCLYLFAPFISQNLARLKYVLLSSTPIGAVILAEVFSRLFNDWVSRVLRILSAKTLTESFLVAPAYRFPREEEQRCFRVGNASLDFLCYREWSSSDS